jgi:DNA-directed RNA polymerase specialized sigma24 family protein
VLALLAEPLALDARRLGRACSRFNDLPEPVRQAFFALVLEGSGPAEVARRSGCSVTEIARRARRALDVFLDRACPAAPPPHARERVQP